jgi:TolB-like protein
VPQIRVIAGNSTLIYKGRAVGIADVARALNASPIKEEKWLDPNNPNQRRL